MTDNMTLTKGQQDGTPSEFTPDWQLSPGELLANELRHRGISQTEFAARTSLSTKHLNQIIKGHVVLSSDAAIAFERSLSIPAAFWLRAEAGWRAVEVTRSSRRAMGQFSTWLSNFPIPLLEQHGVLSKQDDVATRVDKLLRWFEVSDPYAFDRVRLQPEASFKRSQSFTVQPYATAVWLRLAEIEAEKLATTAGVYSPKLVKRAAQQLPGLTVMPTKDGFLRAQNFLKEAGVLLVFVDEITGTRISGASKVLDDGRHMVSLTGRFKYLDSFWFTLAHEIAHVLLHPKRATYIDIDSSVDDDQDAQETEANLFAEKLFLSDETRVRLKSAKSKQAIVNLADELGVASSLLAGQYGQMTQKWAMVASLRKRVDLPGLLGSTT